MASQNASDGVSVIEIADGALSEVQDMLQRMNELTVKAANGTLTAEDRQNIQDEVDQLKAEVTRVSETVEFNGQKILNGDFALKGYSSDNAIKVNSYSEEVATGTYTINSLQLTTSTDPDVDAVIEVDLGDGFPDGRYSYSLSDNLLKIQGEDGFEMCLDVSDVALDEAHTDISIDATGIGAMRLQIGANEGQVLEVNIPKLSLQNLGIESLDVTTQEGATKGIDQLDAAIQNISSMRSKLGAYQNRLESSVTSLDVTEENVTAAYSRIMDVDMAEEMTKYSTYQILTQAGTSVLAQANERPSQVLQLLQ